MATNPSEFRLGRLQTTTGEDINVRSERGTKGGAATILGKLHHGKLYLYDPTPVDGWYTVIFDGDEAYTSNAVADWVIATEAPPIGAVGTIWITADELQQYINFEVQTALLHRQMIDLNRQLEAIAQAKANILANAMQRGGITVVLPAA